MASKKKEPVTTVQTTTVDIARLVAGNGVTLYARFDKKAKAVGLTLGREFPEHGDDFVVSFDAIQAFVKLVNKYTGRRA